MWSEPTPYCKIMEYQSFFQVNFIQTIHKHDTHLGILSEI